MIFHGHKLGVILFPGGKTQWFTNRAEAEAAERVEVARFAAADREREAARLAKLGIVEKPLSYSVSLVEVQPGRKQKRM